MAVDFAAISANMEMWYSRWRQQKTRYAKLTGGQRGTYSGGIWYQDCSSFVSALVLGENGYRYDTVTMVDWQAGSKGHPGFEGSNPIIATWGFKKVATNPGDSFFFKKFDIVVATITQSNGGMANAHTAMIYTDGYGSGALMIHAGSPGEVRSNGFTTSQYPGRTISVWRAKHGVFIYSVTPL